MLVCCGREGREGRDEKEEEEKKKRKKGKGKRKVGKLKDEEKCVKAL